MNLFKKGKHSKLKTNDEQEVQKFLTQTLQLTINKLVDENHKLKDQLKEKEHNELILIENSRELRTKIVDLENNLDFLVGNLTKKNQKIIEKGIEKVIKPKKEGE